MAIIQQQKFTKQDLNIKTTVMTVKMRKTTSGDSIILEYEHRESITLKIHRLQSTLKMLLNM